MKEGIVLAGRTTIGLGGKARLFAQCESVDELRSALTYASRNQIRFMLLGGGSNVIFPDEGFDGLVIGVFMKGYRFEPVAEGILLDAAAGEEWDPLVSESVAKGFAGIECLSGIPGLVGATPIQNVGAYGQEVADTIRSVEAIDLRSMNDVHFDNMDCQFDYRQSRFKGIDKDRFAITRVTFLLHPGGKPSLAYPELRKHIESRHPGSVDIATVRQTVLALRKGKSMVLDPADPNCRSVGSFFMNPIVSREFFETLQRDLSRSGAPAGIPSFPGHANTVKIPAAWLVEHSGFRKGFRKGGVGISANHALALVNHGGTAKQLLALAEEIREAVKRKYSIMLQIEPSIIV